MVIQKNSLKNYNTQLPYLNVLNYDEKMHKKTLTVFASGLASKEFEFILL